MRGIRAFFRHESAGGLLLMAAAVLALVLANSPLTPHYDAFLRLGPGGVTLLAAVNDGLMAVFFLLVGLEVKRELLEGELSSFRQAALPVIAAAGGVVMPAVIYTMLNWGHPLHLRGWAVPTATDIAFSLGVLSLLGRRVPLSLKVFLTALAVIDDLVAVLIIALFYTGGLQPAWLGGALVCAGVLFAMNRAGVTRLGPYLLLGGVLWYATHHSGVHATVAGVALGFLIPLRVPHPKASPPHTLEHALHPWVAYGIMPLFAFCNSGLDLSGIGTAHLREPVTLGVALGLFLGKQAGICGFAWLAVRAGAAALPSGTTWIQFWGVALIAGIGFTMSLFIALLAFDGEVLQQSVRLGVFAGSLLSAVAGYAVLRAALPKIN